MTDLQVTIFDDEQLLVALDEKKIPYRLDETGLIYFQRTHQGGVKPLPIPADCTDVYLNRLVACGHIDAQNVKRFSAPRLEQATSISLEETETLLVSNLRIVDGYLLAGKATKGDVHNLERVTGDFEIGFTHLEAPKARYLGSLVAPNLVSANLTSLEYTVLDPRFQHLLPKTCKVDHGYFLQFDGKSDALDVRYYQSSLEMTAADKLSLPIYGPDHRPRLP